jgi:hypothetical protein
MRPLPGPSAERIVKSLSGQSAPRTCVLVLP